MKLYAHSITSRKNIPLSLAKKFQYKYAYQILNSNPMIINEINTNEIYIKSSNYNELVLRVLNLTSDQFLCYSQIQFKGTTYKIGYFLTRFIEEVCLYEILEIIIVKASFKVQFNVQQIEIDFFNSHLRAYQVNKSKSIILKTILTPDTCNGPPVNINESVSGNLMLRVKEYYSD